MPIFNIVNFVDVKRTPRVLQMEGIFDVAPSQRSERTWKVNLPIEEKPWKIGLIVGASGSGKSTVARKVFGDSMAESYAWPDDKSIVDGFDSTLSIKDITAALSSVGFSSPPSWVRPFRCLSNGEQFRANLARAIVDPKPIVCIDEFTSVVDRQVAKIGSAAAHKAIHRIKNKQLVAVTCHDDVEDWLEPDWVLRMPTAEFAWRLPRQRPEIKLEILRVHRSAWELFKHHHYLDSKLHISSKCFVGFIEGKPVAFTAVISFPHPKRPGWREHRTVCLPDYQGIGIGNKMSELVASIMKATKKPYFSTTGNPSMMRHRIRSLLWNMSRSPTRKTDGNDGLGDPVYTGNRLTAGFEYIGPANYEAAKGFSII